MSCVLHSNKQRGQLFSHSPRLWRVLLVEMDRRGSLSTVWRTMNDENITTVQTCSKQILFPLIPCDMQVCTIQILNSSFGEPFFILLNDHIVCSQITGNGEHLIKFDTAILIERFSLMIHRQYRLKRVSKDQKGVQVKLQVTGWKSVSGKLQHCIEVHTLTEIG